MRQHQIRGLGGRDEITSTTRCLRGEVGHLPTDGEKSGGQRDERPWVPLAVKKRSKSDPVPSR